LFVWERFADNVRYFLFGRYSGLVPYYFPAVVIAFLCLRRPAAVQLFQWLILATVATTAIALLLVLPFTWAGGGGPPGNRYFLSMYPLLLFATPPFGPMAPLVAWIGGALFTAKILLNPFVAAAYPWQPAMRGPLRLLPVELTMANDLPIMIDPNRGRVPHGEEPRLLLYFLDDYAARPERDGIWIAGAARAELIVRTGEPLRALNVTLNSPVRNEVTLGAGAARRTVTIEPGTTTVVAVPVRARYARQSSACLLSIETARGFVPRLLEPASDDRRFLGVQVRLAGVPARMTAPISQ
jgi:hypothetical protein